MLFFWRVEECFEHLKYNFAILLSIVSPTIVKVSLNCISLTKQIVLKSVCFLWLPQEWWALFIQECLLNTPEALAVKNLPAVPETWVRSLGWEDPLEERMATHSSILAWEIEWTEEPGGATVHGVRHNWATNTHFSLSTHVKQCYILYRYRLCIFTYQ